MVSTKHGAPKPTSTPQDQILPRDSVLESTVRNSPSLRMYSKKYQQQLNKPIQLLTRDNPPFDTLGESGILWIGLISKGQGECRNKLYLPFVNLCYVFPVACEPNVGISAVCCVL